MPKCTDDVVEFGRVGQRIVEAAFDGGDIVSDGGVLLQQFIVSDGGVLLQQFIASHAKAPKELVLDVDATHVPLHGEQARGHFHAYCDNCCYLPLYVFAGQDLLACVLRPNAPQPRQLAS